ncbi:helix-turn-helix transcriptional regulator [Paraburkholderia sp. BR14263]|uniref:helix-turn-helix transcriptional regulator n=1 Tax=unclassified Paraburkholderia TaxID=2615204 RepID=UPI0034CEF202
MLKYDPADLLNLLPEDGPGVQGLTTSQVLERAQRAGLPYGYPRAVHRALSALGRLVFHDEGPGRTYLWKRMAGSSGMAATGRKMMRADEAVALQLLKRFACSQMPALVADELAPLMDVAGEVLAAFPESATRAQRKFRTWLSKVAVEPGNFTLRQRPIPRDVFAAVSQALLMENELEFRYLFRTGDPSVAGEEKVRVVHPLGLVEVGGIGYLVACTKARATPAMYRLDRMLAARMLDVTFSYPAAFSLESYVKSQRHFDFFPEGAIKLELRFHASAGDHLIETPMSDDQTVNRAGDALEVCGTVTSSKRLRWWIRSFGPNVEVLGPPALRDEFAGEARALAERYANASRRQAAIEGEPHRARRRRAK